MKIFMIRHGVPDYSYGDSHGFIGHGNDLAPLDIEKIDDVIKTSKDTRLKEAEIIVSSPYTRALQTAAIISKETGIDIRVEPDLREWEPDLSYQYTGNDLRDISKDFLNNKGVRPIDRDVMWESKEEVKNRINSVINKYKNYKCVIFVFHQIAMQSILGDNKIKPAEIVEYEI